jgi:hypothetical protein
MYTAVLFFVFLNAGYQQRQLEITTQVLNKITSNIPIRNPATSSSHSRSHQCHVFVVFVLSAG